MKAKRNAARIDRVKAKGTGEPKTSETAAAKVNAQVSDKETWLALEAAFNNCAENDRAFVSKFAKQITFTATLLEKLASQMSDDGLKTQLLKWVNQCDRALARVADAITVYVRIRAEKTRNDELFAHLYGETLDNLERLPDLWRRFIDDDIDKGDLDSSDSAGFCLPEALTVAVSFFEKECDRHPERFSFWAGEKPYLPMMVFRNKAAYRKRFGRIADAVRLGERCPIHVSERANYSLETPINAKVFEVLLEFSWAFGWIKWVRSKEGKQRRQGKSEADYLADTAEMSRELQPVFFAAYDLPKLTKANAREWADTAIMPYLTATNTDYMTAPEFENIRRRKRVKGRSTARAEVRKDIIRALESLGWPDCPNPPHS